ncbi:hypothetical protein CC79DRAFT_1334099 [Sarocladium strictum]
MTDRYIENDTAPCLSEPDPRSQLLKSLTKLVTNYAPRKPWIDTFKEKPQGLWTGPTSVAYLFFWLSKIYPDLSVEGRLPAEWCERYLDCGSEELTSPKDLNGWGIKNEYLAYNVVKAVATEDMLYVEKVTNALTTDFDCPKLFNEHLSGRAGTLALLRILRHWMPGTSALVSGCMKPLIDHIMGEIPWTFSGHRYIGAAHGDIGILTQLVLCDNSMGMDPRFESQLIDLLDVQQEDGHWPITPDPNLGSPDLVHYCHGSPGFVHSLMKIKPFVRPELQERVSASIDLGRREVWQKGLLRKEPNLCHGITGNMLAFEDWGQREHFMAYATAESIESGIRDGTFLAGDDPYGLLWGEAGRAWGWLMIDAELELGYPSYTDV